MLITRENVGRIAERVVSNELEYRGFRVTNLNKDGIAANADLLAARGGRTWQVQVKGATNGDPKWWWVQYGFCTDAIIDGSMSMFNHRSGFYTANVVVLVAVHAPREYCCVILPVDVAERAAKMNLDRYFRTPKRDGGRKKPGPVWIALDSAPGERARTREAFTEERELLKVYQENWEAVFC